MKINYDGGSSHTIFSPDVLEAVGVTYENGDPVYEAYGIGGTVSFYTKVMDYIQLDKLKAEQMEDMNKLELYTPNFR